MKSKIDGSGAQLINQGQRGVVLKNFLQLNGGVLVAALLIFIVGCFMTEKFCHVGNMLTILRSISATAMCAFGMSFVIISGGIDLSVGSTMSLTGCVCAILLHRYGWAVGPAIAVSLTLSVVCGMMNGFAVTKLRIAPFIATLATMNIFRGASQLLTGGLPVIFDRNSAACNAFLTVGTGYVGKIPLPAIYAVVMLVILWFVLNKTKYGRRVYAVGGNLVAARYTGVNTDRATFITYTLCGLMAGISGIILTARLGSGQPSIGEGAELDAIAACVVGGISMIGGYGSIFGTMVGCVMIGMISNILNLSMIDSFVQLVVKGIVILLAVYIDVLRQGGKAQLPKFLRQRKKEPDEEKPATPS